MAVAERRSDPSLRRAAILLSNLDAENRRRLLAHLPAAEAARLRAAAATLSDVDPLEIRRVVDAFVGRVDVEANEPKPSSTTTAAEKDDRSQAAANVAVNVAKPSNQGPEKLRFLKTVSDGTLLHVLEAEHPQTIAVVLASLEPAQAARLLRRLPTEQRAVAIARLGRLDDIPTEVLDDIASHLRASVGDLEAIAGQTGQQHLSSILAELNDQERVEMVEGLAVSDRVLAVTLENNRVEKAASASAKIIEDELQDTAELRLHKPDEYEPNARTSVDSLAEQADQLLGKLTPKALKAVLAMMDTRDAILTLCGLSPSHVKRLLRSMPRRQVKDVQQRMSQIGELELREIDRAKIKAAELVGDRRLAA